MILLHRYKWTTESPYSPAEQQKILNGETITWYVENYDKLKVIEPDKWMYRVGDRVEILIGKDKGKQGTIAQVIDDRISYRVKIKKKCAINPKAIKCTERLENLACTFGFFAELLLITSDNSKSTTFYFTQ